MKALRMSHQFEMSADALRSLRKLRPNETAHIRRALDTIKQTPVGDSAEYQLLSQNKKHSTYRFRTVVGFVVYNVPLAEGARQRILISNILPFNKKEPPKH
jgi:mRNA-degrading endonuclease RelE of RelBE toxin-antitoxin system